MQELIHINVTKSYLDMARSVVDTSLHGNSEQAASAGAKFSLMSCTYVFSFMALQSFCAVHLHMFWGKENGDLRKKYPEIENFRELMAGPLKAVKNALKELCVQFNIEQLHKTQPQAWRELNEALKVYRDYFVHPNPESFHEHVGAASDLQWGFPSRVVSEIIRYFFEATNQPVPEWLNSTGLRCKGFEVVCI